MAPRFYSSPYKNAVAQVPKTDGWWSELPVSSSAHSDRSDLIKASSEYWLAQGSASGHLVCLPWTNPGKFGGRAPTIQVASRAITDLDVSRFDDLLAAGTEDGRVVVHTLPALSELPEEGGLSPSPLLSVLHPTGRPVEIVSFHPTSSSLLLASSDTTVAIYDNASSAGSPTYTVELPSPAWSAKWSLDGTLLSTTSKDGTLRLYDVRASTSAPSLSTVTHQGPKCSRHVWLRDSKVFTTGFSKTRDREYSLFDARSFDKAIKSQRLDTNTGVLMPVADVDRGIVYLGGRGDMTLRWVEVGGPSTFTEAAAPIPAPIAGFALAPPSVLNLMKAEINRAVVLGTGDAVIPIPLEVPRRQYIDFHADLFPATLARTPGQTAAQWIAGGDAMVELVEQDPKRKTSTSARAPAPTAVASVTSAPPTSLPAPPRVEAAMKALSLAPTPTPSPSPSPAVAPTPLISEPPPNVTPVRAAAPAVTLSGPFNPSWSRKFLTGKTPLKPDYYDLHGLSTTMGADVQLIKSNHLYFFFPLAGAGGRLGMHATVAVGRFPTAIHSLVAGAGIVDFELDPFDPQRVFIASDDSRIRVFKVPNAGLEEDMTDVAVALTDPKMDKITQIQHHPTARNLLSSVSDDHGNATLRLWDVESGSVLLQTVLPPGGISSVAWSPDGDLLAVATKAKTLHVLDPRSPSTLTSSPSHDSIRPVRVAWISPSHLITTGFSKTATREVLLFSSTPSSLSQIGKQTLDVSPAPLFPHVDVDSGILLLYSRGERSCHAFEINPNDKVPFGRLPSFEHGTLQAGFSFAPKGRNDVKSVEVIRCLRLTPSTVEIVSFTVPRARTEFFQDDVFVHTRDVETPTLEAKEWIEGKNVPLRMIDLRPEGMSLLSEAPAMITKGSTRSKISGPVVTESQKAEAYMARLFQAAKADGDEEVVNRSKNAPVDDDDW